MKEIQNAFERMNPDEEQRVRMLAEIRAAEKTARRLPLKRIAAIAAAAALCTATVAAAAVPAVKKYFVPHMGVVEVPVTTAAVADTVGTAAVPAAPAEAAPAGNPYMFLRDVTGEVSGNEYILGYVFGDTAVLHVKTALDTTHAEEYEKYTKSGDTAARGQLLSEAKQRILALENDTIRVRSCTPYGTAKGIYTECEIEITGLDASVAENGLSFMGDALSFTVLGAEYSVMEKQYYGVTLRLIPLSEDNTVFFCELEGDGVEVHSVQWFYTSTILNGGTVPFFEFLDVAGNRYNARIKGDLLYLDEEPAAPITALSADQLQFRIGTETTEFTADVPSGMDKLTIETAPVFYEDLHSDPLTAVISVVRAEDYPNSIYKNVLDHYRSMFPSGVINLSSNTVSLDGGAVQYSLLLSAGGDYSRILNERRENDNVSYPIGISKYGRKIPYFEEIGDSMILKASAIFASYNCDWTFHFPY